MFRKLAKKNKAISEEACIEILKNQKRGILSVLGDDDYPNGTPMNHFYDEETGKITPRGFPKRGDHGKEIPRDLNILHYLGVVLRSE